MAFARINTVGSSTPVIVNVDQICIITTKGSYADLQFSAGNQFGVTLRVDEENLVKIMRVMGLMQDGSNY